MRAIIAAAIAIAATAAPAAAQTAVHQWPASATTISVPPSCPVRVTGGYAAAVGEPTPRLMVQARNEDGQRARSLQLHVTYNTPSGAGRREGSFGPFRVAAGQVQEIRTLSLPPGAYGNSTIIIRVTGCSPA